MSVSPELLEILVCPETKQPVKTASAEVLEKLAREIEAGRLRNRGGQEVAKPISEGLVREDGKVLYPVDDGIPVMLIEESIELDCPATPRAWARPAAPGGGEGANRSDDNRDREPTRCAWDGRDRARGSVAGAR